LIGRSIKKTAQTNPKYRRKTCTSGFVFQYALIICLNPRGQLLDVQLHIQIGKQRIILKYNVKATPHN